MLMILNVFDQRMLQQVNIILVINSSVLDMNAVKLLDSNAILKIFLEDNILLIVVLICLVPSQLQLY